MLFISWKHWVPGYVRNEIKKRTGVAIDGYGNLINKEDNKSESNPLLMLSNAKVKDNKSADEKSSPFKSTSSYKPTTHIVYNKEAMKMLHDKL